VLDVAALEALVPGVERFHLLCDQLVALHATSSVVGVTETTINDLCLPVDRY
jgi:hypothetical protein